MMNELKPCPFCGGKAKVSFRDHAYKGQNDFGDKKLKYRVQVICNRCKSKGKSIFTDWLINPNPWISAWGNQGEETTPRMIAQTEAFKPYVEKAIEAWNRRAKDEQNGSGCRRFRKYASLCSELHKVYSACFVIQ